MESIPLYLPAFIFIIIFFFFFLSCFLWYFSSYKGESSSIIPINWPVLRMAPGLLRNAPRLGDWTTKILQQSHGTFMVKGPWFCKMELLFTADPTNVNYIMCKRHQDFYKGDNFNQIFEVLGDGIFNSDSHKWKYQREIALSFFTSAHFRRNLDKTVKDKLEGSLTPVLDLYHTQGVVVDLQDIFQRLTTDITFNLLTGEDRGELSFDPPSYSFSEGIHNGEEAILLRHLIPMPLWKLLKWLKVGKERKLHKIEQEVEGFIAETIRAKREELMHKMKEGHESNDLLSFYIKQNYGTPDHGFKSVDIFLRDTFVTVLLAGQDTIASALTWLFWLLTNHPDVEAKIKDELKEHNASDEQLLRDPKRLVYLQATIFESLRLYPPVPFNHRAAKQAETLPSGHRVSPWTMIIVSAYPLGRMKWVWGDDCDEFKPERWITEKGEIKHVPANKFFAFNAGPRICLGKEMSLVQIKAVVCHLLRHNYRFDVVEGHRIEPASSVVLMMKHGLKVKVTKDVKS